MLYQLKMGSLIPPSYDDMEHHCGSAVVDWKEASNTVNKTLSLTSTFSGISPSEAAMSSMSVDSQRIDSTRFFVARSSLAVDVSNDAVRDGVVTDTAAGCTLVFCRHASNARAVERSHWKAESGGGSLIFDTDELIQVVFAAIDVILIASRWCCLHTTLHSGVVEPRPSSRSTGTGNMNNANVSTASHSASSTAATAGMNGRSAAMLPTNDKTSTIVNELPSSKDVNKCQSSSCCCYPGPKCQSHHGPCHRRRHQQTVSKKPATSSSISVHSPMAPEKYENWEGLMGDFQFVGNSPTSSSSSCAKHVEMIKLPSISSSTSATDFVTEMTAPEIEEAKSRLAANSAEDVLGRLTICAVTLALIYVIVATFECMVREFASLSAPGMAPDRDLWRMEEELRGAVKHQVLYYYSCFLFFKISMLRCWFIRNWQT
jgi:hypothetical protein